MSKSNQEKVVAFDTLFTTNHIQMLKILLSYMEPSQQKTIAVYIKFLELEYTISFLKKHPYALSDFPKEKNLDTAKICDEISPFLSPSEQEKLCNIRNMLQNFENMQEMMQMVQMMKDLFPEGDNPLGGDPSALFSGMSGMSGMDMSQIFEMFQNK